MILFAFFFIFASIIWFSGYFTGRDAEQKMGRSVDRSLGRVLTTKGL
jgi:hypothetical protein